MLSTTLPRMTVLLGATALLVGCVQQTTVPLDDFNPESIAVHETEALGGAALMQRKQEMQRAVRDVAAFHKTMEGMIARRDTGSVRIFADFLDRYMGKHLEPMLKPEWQSKHPELVDLDVTLRIQMTSMLVQMRKPKQVERSLLDIMTRYRGRESTLIDYPLGEQSSLGEAIASLRSEMDLCTSIKAEWGPGARKVGRVRDDDAQPVCMGAI